MPKSLIVQNLYEQLILLTEFNSINKQKTPQVEYLRLLKQHTLWNCSINNNIKSDIVTDIHTFRFCIFVVTFVPTQPVLSISRKLNTNKTVFTTFNQRTITPKGSRNSYP